MRFLAFLLIVATRAMSQVATLGLDPFPGCVDGVGRVRVAWSAPGSQKIQVLVGTPPDQAPLTSFDPPVGSTETGLWVTEGLRFTLVDEAGSVLATAAAALDCEGAGRVLENALGGLGLLPLQVGNRWVYRSNTRQVTATHYTRTITGVESIGGRTYFVLDNPVTRLRSDGERIYELRSSGEVLLLDPTAPSSADAALPVNARVDTISTPFGRFPGAVHYQVRGFRFETGTYVRGLGLLRYSAQLLAGSSGGFLDDAELVEARIAGKLYYRLPAPGIYLAAERTQLDVTGRRVTNCAVPCYFVACGLAPGADPQGTYKPCFQTRVAGENTPAGSMVELALIDSTGTAVTSTAIEPGDPAEFLHYRQLPLYSAPNQPFPSGQYRLRARILNAGSSLAEATVSVEIR